MLRSLGWSLALLITAALISAAGVAEAQVRLNIAQDPDTGAPVAPPPPAETREAIIKRITMPLAEVSLTLKASDGKMPEDNSRWLFRDRRSGNQLRPWAIAEYHWAASELAYQPLYWNQTPLERYGQTISPALQPIISGAHFFGTFPLIPYKIGIDRTHDRISTLGYYRPGSYAPCMRQRLPWEWDAAGIEAATWIALIAIFP